MRKKPEDKKATGKYASMYMSIGMCIGIGIGMCLGNAIFDNLAIGMSFGVGVGLSLGCAYGASLDKKALNVVEIIEDDFGCEGVPEDAEATVTVVVTDAEGKNSASGWQISSAMKEISRREIPLCSIRTVRSSRFTKSRRKRKNNS